jgi:hypothetical protein
MDGPRVGMVGVVRLYRRTSIAAALLRQSLSAAAEWGGETFTAETSPDNGVIYPRLKRLDAVSLGQSIRLVRS